MNEIYQNDTPELIDEDWQTIDETLEFEAIEQVLTATFN